MYSSDQSWSSHRSHDHRRHGPCMCVWRSAWSRKDGATSTATAGIMSSTATAHIIRKSSKPEKALLFRHGVSMLHFANLPFRSSAGRPCCGARPTRDPPIVMSVLLFDCFVLVRCMSSLLCAPQACPGLAQLSRNGHFGLAPWWRSLCDCTTRNSTDIFWRVPRIWAFWLASTLRRYRPEVNMEAPSLSSSIQVFAVSKYLLQYDAS